jgi:hypothetical protein
MFEAAVSKSPGNSVDIVIANAGVGRGSGDPMMQLEGKSSSRPTHNHCLSLRQAVLNQPI